MNSRAQPSPLRSGDAYDVIVVGARVAGAATAMLLARHGLRTLVLDHSAPGSDTLSTHALMRGGVLQLARWGLLDEIVRAGTPAVRRTTFRYGNEDVVISLKAAHGVDALYAPRRTVLDPLIVQAAVDASAEVHHHTPVADLLTHAGRVVGVRATTPDARSVEIGASLVIGADGIRSTVARRAGASFSRTGYHAGATTYGYWSGLETDGYEFNFRRDASSGVIPTNGGQACVFAAASPERIGRGGVAIIGEIVAEGAPQLAERLDRAIAPRGARTWSGRRGYIRNCHGPGWALVGDAGYFNDPISAHGLTDALRDAELLARAVVSGVGDATTLHDALAEYQAARDRLCVPMFEVVDRIAAHDWTDDEIAQFLLQLNSATANEVETLAAFEKDPVS